MLHLMAANFFKVGGGYSWVIICRPLRKLFSGESLLYLSIILAARVMPVLHDTELVTHNNPSSVSSTLEGCKIFLY